MLFLISNHSYAASNSLLTSIFGYDDLPVDPVFQLGDMGDNAD